MAISCAIFAAAPKKKAAAKKPAPKKVAAKKPASKKKVDAHTYLVVLEDDFVA